MTDPAAKARCNWLSGKHLWSITDAHGRQECLWCPAVKVPEPTPEQVRVSEALGGGETCS